MKYLVHIGYPKAASSFLQSTLFSGSHTQLKPLKSNQKCLGEYQKLSGNYFNQGYEGYLNSSKIRALSPFTFNAEEEREKLNKLTYKSAEISVLSNELLCGHPFSGGISAKEYADRIHKTIPNCKILIIIRKQENMLLSSYAHFLVKSGGICKLENYLNSLQHTQIPWHTPFYYCYNNLVAYYAKKFGHKNVLVLPFELIEAKGEKFFLKKITSYLGVSEYDIGESSPFSNARDYKTYVVLRRHPWINLFAPKNPANGNFGLNWPILRKIIISLGRLFVSEKLLDRQKCKDLKIINKHFAPYLKESNVDLEKFVKYDLKKLGYTV